jgi:flavin reductase (DIM6/NTAB) family NADH-FMN oxidoreductase RutF
MKLVKKILTQLNGLYYPQEYLCFANESFEQPLHAYLLIDGLIVKDITNLHSFVGYSPLVFALLSSETTDCRPQEIQIAFTRNIQETNEDFVKKEAIAMLTMKKIGEQPVDDETSLLYFEGMRGSHRFISAFHQFFIQLYNRLYHKKPGNIFLPGNLYQQVQIAYSLPRNISMITVGQNNRFNLFPTDLHGQVYEDLYIISLRHEGKAGEQVIHTGKILISKVHSDFYKMAYALGKNHMQEMKEKKSFPFSSELSALLKLPLPQSCIYYRELELQDSFIHGIHRIMLFKILYHQHIRDISSTLVHVHNVYATWRQNNQLPGNYLIR